MLVAHYNGPSYLSPLVEIVRNDLTSDETVEAVYQILLKVGKSPVLAQKEVPGFIANRLLAALLREALSMVQRGIASPEDIDTVLKTGHARRWVVAGVFEMVEIAAGWDLALAAYPQVLPDIDSSPSDILTLVKEMVDQGKLGSQVGPGFLRLDAGVRRGIPSEDGPGVYRNREVVPGRVRVSSISPTRMVGSRLTPGC